MPVNDIMLYVIGALFTAAGFLALFRIVRGPSILDRMIASDMLLTTLILVVGAEMVINGHTRNVPMMIALAGVAVFATIAVARYVSKQDVRLDEGADGPKDAADDIAGGKDRS